MPPIRRCGVSIHSSDMSRQDETNKHEVSNQNKQSNISSDNESTGGRNSSKRKRVRRSGEKGSSDSSNKRASCAQVEMNTRKASIPINNGNQAIGKANNKSFMSSK